MLQFNVKSNGKAGSSKRGYTLIEIMIAMTVLAIAMSAISMMNFSSLSAYVSARDTTESNLLAQKTITMMKAEAEQWKTAGTLVTSSWAGPSDALYQGGTAYGTTPILKAISAASPGTWVRVTTQKPVAGTGEAGNTVQGRFCVAARQVSLPSDVAATLKALRIQLAVYYPPPGVKAVADCDALLGNSGNLQVLSQGANYAGQTLLETTGTRVDFYSTVIVPPVP